MNKKNGKQDNTEQNDQTQPLSEDLRINDDQAGAVKGGTYATKSVRFKAGKSPEEAS